MSTLVKPILPIFPCAKDKEFVNDEIANFIASLFEFDKTPGAWLTFEEVRQHAHDEIVRWGQFDSVPSDIFDTAKVFIENVLCHNTGTEFEEWEVVALHTFLRSVICHGVRITATQNGAEFLIPEE